MAKKKKSSVRKKPVSGPRAVPEEDSDRFDRSGSVHVQLGRTVNLGNYESMRVDYGETVAVSAGELRAPVIKKLTERVQGMLDLMVDSIEEDVS